MLLTPAVSVWFATHHGAATRAQLLRLGVTADQLEHAARIGVLVRPVRGVYVLAASPPTELRAAAVACACGADVVISHQTAARLWGLRGIAGPRDAPVHVTFPWGRSRAVPGAIAHRSGDLSAADVVGRRDGIRLTSPPRTAFDAAAYLEDVAFESLLEQVLHDHCTMPTVLATGRRLARRGRAGTERFFRVVHRRPAWLKPVDSALELRVERAIVAAGLPRPLRQHPIALRRGDVVRPDFFWPSYREALEVDHVTWHGGKLDLTYDQQRDRRLWSEAGVHVTRVTDGEVRAGLGPLLDALRLLLEPRSRARWPA